MISEERYARFNEKRQQIQNEIQRLTDIRIKPNDHTQSVIESKGGSRLKDGILAIDLLRRPEMTYDTILEILEDHQLPDAVEEQVEIQTKYEGYINKSLQQVEKVKRMEEKKIPEDLDYSKVDSLASEARKISRSKTIKYCTSFTYIWCKSSRYLNFTCLFRTRETSKGESIMSVEWLSKKLSEHGIELSETQKNNSKRTINYLLSGMKR